MPYVTLFFFLANSGALMSHDTALAIKNGLYVSTVYQNTLFHPNTKENKTILLPKTNQTKTCRKCSGAVTTLINLLSAPQQLWWLFVYAYKINLLDQIADLHA